MWLMSSRGWGLLAAPFQVYVHCVSMLLGRVLRRYRIETPKEGSKSGQVLWVAVKEVKTNCSNMDLQ